MTTAPSTLTSPLVETSTPSDPDGVFIETGRGRVHVVDEGFGHPFFLLHGIPGTVRDFRYLAPRIAERGARAIRVDFPGFGATNKDVFPGVTSMNRAALIVRLADVLGIDTFSVVGHSFGGGVAMALASGFPERVRTMGLLASIGAIRHKAFPAIPRRFLDEIARGLTLPGPDLLLGELMKRGFRAVGLVPDERPDVLAFWVKLMASVDFAAHRAFLARVKCPTLLVSADDDPMVEPKITLDTGARLDDAKVAVRHLRSRTGGHQVQKTMAPAIADALLDRLAVAGFG